MSDSGRPLQLCLGATNAVATRWRPQLSARCGRSVGIEEARQAASNTLGFLALVAEWKREADEEEQARVPEETDSKPKGKSK